MPNDTIADARARLTAWTDPNGPARLRSAGFSEEARRHYRAYTGAWLDHCAEQSIDPYDRARDRDGDSLTHLAAKHWIKSLTDPLTGAPVPLATKAVVASALKSFYAHLLEQGVTDGIELSRAALIGAPVPTEPTRTGLRGDGPRWILQAADRLNGPDADRDRAILYLLMNQYLGHQKLRPSMIRSMEADGGTNEGFRTTWKVNPANASDTVTISVTISRDAARLIDTYTAGTRAVSPARGTTATTGPLFTASGNRARGAGLSRSDAVNRIVAKAVASHEELAPWANRLSADFIAATQPATKNHEDQRTTAK
ncbi:hypothetical protein [Streptomyces sp. NPDC056883]|uniref:hypothetical protein n=1 Tax=Streptomyces sp. NPDC056883 TaxID=3345959 RepID=UPI0036AC298F